MGDGGERVEADGFGVSDWLKAIGGVAFFIAGVLTWWELEYGPGLSTRFNGFDYRLTGLLPYVIFVGIAVLTIIVRTESLRLPQFVVNPVLTLVAATVGTVLVGVRFFVDGYDNDDLEAAQNSIHRGVGMYLALGAALVVLVGCVLAYRDERVAVDDDDDDEVGDAADDTPTATERPPRPSSPPLP